MNIILFLNKDLHANLSYNLLKDVLLKHDVRIYYSESVGNQNKKPTDLLRLEYFEKCFFSNLLEDFIKPNLINNSFEIFDTSFNTPRFKPCADVNSADFINEIKSFEPDLFISIRFGKIFKDEVIKIPKYGLLNLHSGMLPDYRGIMGTLYALKNGAKEIGCTLHTIPNSGIDTGEIIAITKMPVNHNKSLFWHIANLYPLGCKLISNALSTLSNSNSIISTKQNLKEGNYYSLPTENDFDAIKKIGFDIINTNDYLDFLDEYILPKLNPKLLKEVNLLIETKMKNKN
jgi:methionyl-tRNA formyltransferase